MKKILAIFVALLMGMASVSIVSSGGVQEYICDNYPPSMCQQCVHDQCACRNVPGFCWCHDYCSVNCNQIFPTYGCPVESISPECQACLDNCCEVESFQYCQKEWFHPYWMEIYDSEVKGCYVRDLLCFNMPKSTQACSAYCDESCDDMPFFNQCLESCESSDCYSYCELSEFEYPDDLIQTREIQEGTPKLVLTVPSCTNSRSFFQSPPPCGILEVDASVEDPKKINGNGLTVPRGCCFDMRGCTTNTLDCSKPCTGYNLPPNYSCNINQIVILVINDIQEEILINGVRYTPNQACEGPGCQRMIVWYNGQKPFSAVPGIVYLNQGVPRTITIEGGSIDFSLEQKCCYDCTPKPPLPAILLYPKVDIETFSVPGGATVIQDGKIVSSFEMSPGSQQVFLQVENRGFFTQNDTRLRFDGLPEGVTVEAIPATQKIKAHNIGTYSAIFTLGSNVPSGTYKITMVAYSSSGVFDTATIDFVVP